MAAALMSEKIGLDFDDTLQYYMAKKLGVDAVVSFDEHFDNVDLQRVEPRDLLHSIERPRRDALNSEARLAKLSR